MKNPELRNKLFKSRGFVIGNTANRKLRIKIRTVGIPFELTKWIESREKDIKLVNHLISTKSKKNQNSTIEEELKLGNNFLKEFKEKMVELNWTNKLIDLIKRYLVWFGPKRCGTNMLISQIIEEDESIFNKFDHLKQQFWFEEEKKEGETSELSEKIVKKSEE